MNTQINYGNFGRSKELEELILHQVRKLNRHVDDATLAKIWVNNETNIEGRGAPQYSTQVELHRPNGKNYFIKKTEPDYFNCIKNTFKSLKRILSKE